MSPPHPKNQIRLAVHKWNKTQPAIQWTKSVIKDKIKPSEHMQQKVDSRTNPGKLKANPIKAVVKKKVTVLPYIKKFLSLKKSEITEKKLAQNIIPEPIPHSGPDLPIPVSRDKMNISG